MFTSPLKIICDLRTLKVMWNTGSLSIVWCYHLELNSCTWRYKAVGSLLCARENNGKGIECSLRFSCFYLTHSLFSLSFSLIWREPAVTNMHLLGTPRRKPWAQSINACSKLSFSRIAYAYTDRQRVCFWLHSGTAQLTRCAPGDNERTVQKVSQHKVILLFLSPQVTVIYDELPLILIGRQFRRSD